MGGCQHLELVEYNQSYEKVTKKINVFNVLLLEILKHKLAQIYIQLGNPNPP